MRPSKPEAADGPTCKRIALDLLARREHSRQELARKLAARSFPHDIVASVLADLERTGALAESRFTESFVRVRVARGRGPARIRAELAQRGVADAEIDKALREADVDWLDAIQTVRRRRFGAEVPRDYRERARQARFLEYRGFDSARIRAALELDADSD